jgi:ribosomal protein S18 acetylase RimI-like enzyme
MNKILRDPSASALIAAIKTNLFEYYEYLGLSPKAEFYDSPNITWLITGIPDAFMNGVFRAQLSSDNVDKIIEDTLTHFKSRNVTAFSWWTEPGTQPSDLGKHLEAHGLIYYEGGPGMAVDLLELSEDLPTSTHLTIEAVGDSETLKKWGHAATSGFELPNVSENACFDLFIGLGFDLPLRNYVGLLDGKPVATSQFFLGAGVAGIYWVATAPEARRQGIGAAMTLVPLCKARAMGYHIGILHSSPMGLGVYRRLGFQEYCKMSYYGWADEIS